MSSIDFSLIRRHAIDRFVLDPHGLHGLKHWERVHVNGLELAKETRADLIIVRLFAYLHDCCRENDGSDPEHGPRAVQYLQSLQTDLLPLSDKRMKLLHTAIDGHTRCHTHPDITVQTCWDADRLDLPRVGILPDPRRLCTKAAKRLASNQF